jgi:hypothetical protein
MNGKLITRLALLGLLLMTSVGATSRLSVKEIHAAHGCSMFPPNNLRFPVRAGGHISEVMFRQFLQVAQQTYAPIFRQAGLGLLQIVPRWESPDVNAQAYPLEREVSPGGPKVIVRMVDIFGGLARHPMMSAEGLLLVVCHEIGHHIAGYPHYGQSQGQASWGSNEGQSDYFATAKCGRMIFGQLRDNVQWAQRAPVPTEVRVACNANFPGDRNQAAICMRQSLGGLSLARVLGSFAPRAIPVDFRNMSREVVAATFDGHPEAQCRLDTYFAGAICQADPRIPFSKVEPRQGACTPQQRMRSGYRPACWFRSPI